jgi:hypothetical protein
MTTPREELIERATGFIHKNATKDPAAMHQIVQQGHDQLTGLLDTMSDQQAAFKPAPDVWSVLELMAHVVTAKGGVARICQRLARGETPANRGAEGEEQDGISRLTYTSLAEVRPALDEAHRELLAFIDGPLAGANTQARFKHFVFGDLNCAEWAVFQRVHDGDHSGQVQQITSAPGYPYVTG